MKDRLDLTDTVHVAGVLLVALLVVAILCVNPIDISSRHTPLLMDFA